MNNAYGELCIWSKKELEGELEKVRGQIQNHKNTLKESYFKTLESCLLQELGKRE
jgi:hypothetical protein